MVLITREPSNVLYSVVQARWRTGGGRLAVIEAPKKKQYRYNKYNSRFRSRLISKTATRKRGRERRASEGSRGARAGRESVSSLTSLIRGIDPPIWRGGRVA